ncbi:hypothetical protein [Kibdelosporangium phytohabitans]|uniref:Uncharacterized protein n=1 Tax=Kibdelosporangium phytohabitans TaxID=860235 RepID=A0A0N9I4U1_9PSEU|nr:hypothetical protein [Kibdelosporangium phytohabitans]ALG09396.1 hypothetical protein AOZ06_23005 [Kibdelosporangium phytohabitans]MBE1469332.1 hypothetical protein [Kibdelosporangium phytohabitans]
MIEHADNANVAEEGAAVGIQAEYVHNSTVYQVFADSSPRQKYEVGVRLLEDGVPKRAKELIDDAIARGHDNGEVRFHWMLAMLGKRSLRDLTAAERAQLEWVCQRLHSYADDVWKQSLEAVCELVNSLRRNDRECKSALERLHGLPVAQREKIVRHLDLVLTGGMKDTVWAGSRQKAEQRQLGNDRRERVWAYFHPDPVPPRVRAPLEVSTVPGDTTRAKAWSVLAVLAYGHLCWLVLTEGVLESMLACALIAPAGYFAARHGLEWRYRSARRRAKENDFAVDENVRRPPEPGFANAVTHSFTHYFGRYLPQDVDREQWLARTLGVRTTLRDEIVEVYREERIKVDRVNWLIGYLAADVRSQWTKGTLLRHRERYRTDPVTKLVCSIALVVVVVATVLVAVLTVPAQPLPVLAALTAMLTGGRWAAQRWYGIVSEERRFAEDSQDQAGRLDERQAAYERWKARLDSTRPSEHEMETWLRCDKTMLLDAALRHYGLVWREVITHAFLQAPSKPYQRARVKNGPWRYSKYDIRLFLITQDGVREVSTRLDFERVDLKGQERNNYRFDAVSSVQVVESAATGCALELTLFNGPSRNIPVVEPGVSAADGESPAALSETSLDSAGFAHTLHILEGIAAEGKTWIDRDTLGRTGAAR